MAVKRDRSERTRTAAAKIAAFLAAETSSEVVVLFEQAMALFWQVLDERTGQVARDPIEELRSRWQLEQQLDEILNEVCERLDTLETLERADADASPSRLDAMSIG